MLAERPDKLIDPVCGMTVGVARAEAAGLLLEHEGRTWGFCREGCKDAFAGRPAAYIAGAELAVHRAADPRALPVIDEGARRWYESCSCCLSDNQPEIRAQADAGRAAAAQAPVDPGILEVGEAAEPAVPSVPAI